MRAALLAALSAFAVQACATAMEPDRPEDESSTGSTTVGGTAGHGGTISSSGGNSGAGAAARAGDSAVAGSAGHENSGGNRSMGGSSSGGAAGATANGGGGSSAGGASNGGTAQGGGNVGGSVNQGGGAACDQGAATALSSMNSNTTVKSDACLAIQIPADQTWIKKVTLQPEGATYPLPFTWSNCGTNNSGAFTANYANFVLDSVTSQCPILIKLDGSGASFNVQWWGG